MKFFFTLTHAGMLTYPNRSEQKRRAIIIIYEKTICFVTASHYSSCYCTDEELQYFAFWFLSTQYLLKRKALFLYFILGPLAALYTPCISANRSNNATKHREVFQKTQSTKGTCACTGFEINRLAKGIRLSDTIFGRCRFEGAITFLSESQAPYERGRNQNYTLLLKRRYPVCSNIGVWLLGSLREITLFSCDSSFTWNEAGQGRPAGCEEEEVEKMQRQKKNGRKI